MDSPDQTPTPPSKPWHRLRRVGLTLLSTVQNRIELFGLELHEERQWTITTLIWAGAAIFLVGCALLIVTGTLVYLTPLAIRPYVLIGVSLVYVAAALSAVLGLRKRLLTKPPPFSDTVAELKKDLACFQPPHGPPAKAQTGTAPGERTEPADSTAGAGPASAPS